MKKVFLSAIFAATLLCAADAGAQNILPEPRHRADGMTLDQALANRKSERDFNPSKPIDNQTLSDLLWAAAGINRPESGKRTNPTTRNLQEIDIYVFTPEGVSLYDAKTNSLKMVADGDHRQLVAGGQGFVNDAPVSLLLVADLEKFGKKNERSLMMGMADAGIVCQNINLFCAANGLATVPRATMDSEGIKKLLGLSENQIPALNNPVGYAK